MTVITDLEIEPYTFPHGEVFGGSAILEEASGARHGFAKHKVKKEWYGLFERKENQWTMTYMDGIYLTHIVGVGETPREAFDSLVDRWTFLNGGVESPTLRAILPGLRLKLDEVGL